MQFTCILICLIGNIGRVQTSNLESASSVEEAKLLRQKLFTTGDYDKNVRPSKNYAEPTFVYVTFFLHSINDLDESAEILTTTGYIYASWYDSELVWNVTDFGNISYMYFPQNDVWKPDIALANTVKQFENLGIETLNVKVDFDGYIRWYPFQLFKSYCAIDMTHFPFDEQTCKLKFVAWTYTVDDVRMEPSEIGSALDIGWFEPSSQWDIIGTDATTEDTVNSEVVFVLKLKRKPRFFLMSVILPTVMLSFLSVLTFLLPCDSGEKASYAVTVFLSFSLFLTIISSTLPKNSDTTSVFSVYLVIQTVQSTLITIITMTLIRISHIQPETRVPKFLSCLVRCLKCQACSIKRTKVSSAEDKAEVKEVENGFLSRNGTTATDALASTSETMVIDWKGVVNALDMCFLVFFSLFTVIATVVCLGIASSTF